MEKGNQLAQLAFPLRVKACPDPDPTLLPLVSATKLPTRHLLSVHWLPLFIHQPQALNKRTLFSCS